MPVRDIVVTAIVIAYLPVSLARPWVGVLLWSWIGYMNPHRLAWGFAYDMPFAQMAAVVTLAGYVFTREKYPLPRTREVLFLLLLWAVFLLSTLAAFYPTEAWGHLVKVSKILLMTFMTILLCRDARKVQALLWVIALSIGFFGLKGGIWAISTGGTNQVLGPAGSFFEGNTEVGLALNMILPLLLFLRRRTARPWLRHFLLAMFGFSIVAILVTYSRGALLGLAVVVVLLFMKSRTKLIALVLLAVALPLAASTLPDYWFERMQTIETYEHDPSARGRLTAWRVAYQIALDHPFLGGGFRTFTRDVFARYGVPTSLDAHSIYFQVLGEHGFTGLAVYLALIVSTMLSLRRLARAVPADPALGWIPECARMLEASLAGYLVSGAFLSLSYIDLYYHLVAVTIILKALAEVPVAPPAAATPPPPRPVAFPRLVRS
jgi:probable O-glycosylation ligase (exosortase A-associated)